MKARGVLAGLWDIFQAGSYRFGEPYRRSIYLIEALYTLNSPPVVSVKTLGRVFGIIRV